MYSFKSLRVLIRNFILRYITGLWICLRYFVRFTFHLRLFCWFFINHSSVYPFSSIVCKHVEGGFHPSFSISCFSHGIKLTFLRGTITDDYWPQYYVNVTSIVTCDLESYFLLYVCGVSPLYWNIEKKNSENWRSKKRSWQN